MQDLTRIPNISGQVEKLVEEKMADIKDKEKRQSNIIVYGQQESEKSESKEKFTEDTEKITELLEEELEVQAKILTCFRIGLKKPEGKNKTSQERLEVTKKMIRRKKASK